MDFRPRGMFRTGIHPIAPVPLMIWGIVLALIGCAPAPTIEYVFLDYGPSDTRSWEQVTADFVAQPGRYANDGERDGRRLHALDPQRATAFLLPFLAKDKPVGVRFKAIGALGWLSIPQAIGPLGAIALDETESESLRAAALNPGLRYMHRPQAIETAAQLVASPSVSIRRAAYWVLSQHGTNGATAVLVTRLRSGDPPLFCDLIYALAYSPNLHAGELAFEIVPFSTIEHDEELLRAYAIAMKEHRVADAQQNMLRIAGQPTHPLSAHFALEYFASFPREDVVPALVSYLEADTAVQQLYETVNQFVRSPEITSASRRKLSAFIASGKVKVYKVAS